MIDHIGFSVSDYARAKAFYEKALAPLGYTLVMEVTAPESGEPAAGLFHDRLEGGHVPGMHAMLDHELTGSLCHQHMAVKVAVAALGLNPPRQVPEYLSTACSDEP